jgi:hypothetical protein
MEKPNKFDRHSNVKDLLASMDSGDSFDIKPSQGPVKFTVKVGDKFAYKDIKSPNRYSLSDKPNYFYREVEAQDAYRTLKNKGAVLNKEE